MAHSLSAKKRIRQNEKRRAVNRWRKRRIHDALREYDELILHGSVEDCEASLNGIYRLLDRTATTSTLHKNTANRKKSRLTARLNAKKTAGKA